MLSIIHFSPRDASLCFLVGIRMYPAVPKGCSWSSEGVVVDDLSCGVMLPSFAVVQLILLFLRTKSISSAHSRLVSPSLASCISAIVFSHSNPNARSATRSATLLFWGVSGEGICG